VHPTASRKIEIFGLSQNRIERASTGVAIDQIRLDSFISRSPWGGGGVLGTQPCDLGPRTGSSVSAEMEASLVTVPAGLVL